jgi:hypothetical protein
MGVGGQQPYPRIPIDIQKWSPSPLRTVGLCAYVAQQNWNDYPQRFTSTTCRLCLYTRPEMEGEKPSKTRMHCVS